MPDSVFETPHHKDAVRENKSIARQNKEPLPHTKDIFRKNNSIAPEKKEVVRRDRVVVHQNKDDLRHNNDVRRVTSLYFWQIVLDAHDGEEITRRR